MRTQSIINSDQTSDDRSRREYDFTYSRPEHTTELAAAHG